MVKSASKNLVLSVMLVALAGAVTLTDLSHPGEFAALGRYGVPIDLTSIWGVLDPLIDFGPDVYWCASDAFCDTPISILFR